MAAMAAASDTAYARAAMAAEWYRQLRDTSNDSFMPLYTDKHRHLVLKGGGGSGKSIFAGRKLIERCMSETRRPHRFLVCRKVARTLRQSCFPQLMGQIREHYPEVEIRVNQSDMTITFPHGAEFIFAGLDDVEKLKSIYAITGIWIEEASEIEETDFNQLDIRLRGQTEYYKQIILTFNPVSIEHWLKRRFFDEPDDRVKTHETTYRDNRFLDAESIRTLEAFKDTDEYYYSVYCLGQWGVLGKSVFNSQALQGRLAELRADKSRKVMVGYFEDDKFVEDNIDGFIRVFSPPEPGKPYVIGADTAGEGSDYFAAVVLDNSTGEQVAVLHRRYDEDLFAKQLAALGYFYNTALLAPEINFSSYTVLELERMRYPRMYMREEIDDYTHKLRRAFGFRTDSKSRPVIIAGLIKAVREDPGIVHDERTIHEMLTFVRNERFRPEASEGAHDDLVMAFAIAEYVRPHMRYTVEAQSATTAAWSESMWEDYRRASEDDRRYLISKWGEPK
jgi:phage terminase large subunit